MSAPTDGVDPKNQDWDDDHLVERLRGNGSTWGPLMREAADEIQRLRLKLKVATAGVDAMNSLHDQMARHLVILIRELRMASAEAAEMERVLTAAEDNA